ncbi:MAG: long-chain fatty acid--CoA ligase [Sphingomonadales bacterium]|nr:long-chain fatty acid--CoA ligase [Sphingomonadales bacterium]MBK6492077.1 long-chain fatty acid--CoA ligase [Sphingomonadales bacterium]MBK6718510.1 long-chain fatty acid--CoA ligase [Sphingomonadales bacterium]MBK8862351.1 long-chain fatty acid--CoA ligase [Sphingomonadales bacterium]
MRQFEEFPNLVTMFFRRAEAKGNAPFLWHKSEGRWQSLSWADAARQVTSLAVSLADMGLKRGDRVMLVSENRPEWCIADLGIMAAGCITVPTYTTNGERDHQHIIEDSGASAIIVSSQKLAAAVMPAAIRATNAQHIVGIEPLRVGQTSGVKAHDWSDLVGKSDIDVAACAARAEAEFKREDLACIIYTSGTGGAPRGVQQHHGAILLNVAGCVDIISNDFGWGDEVFLSFLPLSHAYEHSGGQFLPIGLGGQIYYAEGLEKLAGNIEEVRPTIMVVVPRLFEVLRARMLKTVEKQGKFAQALLRRALNLGEKDMKGGVPIWDKPMNLFIDKTLRPKIQQRFGGRMKALVSGGAPLNPDVGIFFHSVGLTLLQGYGQTEAGPVISCNRPSVGLKMDTVGPPMKGVEVKIAGDGEILVRGELVMHGYWRNEAETARVLKDGWLHTGDIGEFDENGRIRITDRKKDIIVNDKGENISPQKIEGMLTLQPEIIQAMVSGDKRPHLVALVVPDPEWAAEWAVANDIKYDLKALSDLPAFRSAVMEAVDRVNRQVTLTEKVRNITLTPDGFTIDNEMLTPSLKIRRHMIRQVYGEQIDALYRG